MTGNITKSWFRKLVEYLPCKGLKPCPQSAGSENGFALVTVIVILTIMGISAGIAGVFSVKIMYSRHERMSRDQLDVLKEAITGNPGIRVNAGRADFGFCGNMGGVPASLEELYKMGNQPAYAYDTVKNVGAGWNGPYIDPFIIEYIDDLKKDAFGYDYDYSTNQPDRPDGEEVVARITSKGADGILDSDDRYVEILKGEVFSTVTGKVVSPNGDELQNAYVTINMPEDGVLITKFDWTDPSGDYVFTDVPFGISSIEITATSGTGSSTGGLVYVQNSAAAVATEGRTGNNNTVEFMISNLDSAIITVKALKVEWDTGEYLSEVHWKDESGQNTFVTVWDYSLDGAFDDSNNPSRVRAASNDLLTFPQGDEKSLAGMSSTALAATTEIVHVDEATVTVQNSVLGLGAGAGGQVTIQLFDFKNNSGGNGGGNPSLGGTDFTVTFTATTNETYEISFRTAS